jgi:hypothetical protein
MPGDVNHVIVNFMPAELIQKQGTMTRCNDNRDDGMDDRPIAVEVLKRTKQHYICYFATEVSEFREVYNRQKMMVSKRIFHRSGAEECTLKMAGIFSAPLCLGG